MFFKYILAIPLSFDCVRAAIRRSVVANEVQEYQIGVYIYESVRILLFVLIVVVVVECVPAHLRSPS